MSARTQRRSPFGHPPPFPSASSVDGQTVAGYGENLSGNVRDLLARAKSGSYQAPPVKRAYVPKNEKEDRPIGLPTVEDKILQRAVAMILEPIYEQEFLPFSFGFRPGRSPHQALECLRTQCFEQKVQWVLEVVCASSSTRWIITTCGNCWAAGCRTE